MNSRNLNVSQINYYFGKKDNLLIFLLLLLGVLIPTLSGTSSNNFWYRWFNILNSPFFNFMFFMAIGLNVIYVSSELSKSYYLVSRYKSYKKVIKEFARIIMRTTIVLSIVAIILSISGAILFSYGDLQMISHPYYNISVSFYIVFYIIRFIMFSCMINSILYLLSINVSTAYQIIIFLFSSSLFMLLPNIYDKIIHFYNMPLMYHYYFSSVPYGHIFIEIICSILQFFILLTIYNLLYKFITVKKRDLK